MLKNRPSYDAEVDAEVAKEYQRLQDEKPKVRSDHERELEFVRTRVLDLECSLTRLEEDMTTSYKRMEKMMQCLLHKVGSKQSIAGDDIQAQASSAKYIRCFRLSVFRNIDVPNLSRRTTSIGVRKLGRYHILEA